MSEWKTIESAPTDLETLVDLWIVKSGQGRRVADCHRSYGEHKCWLSHDGKWVTGRWYFDKDEEDRCYDPLLADDEAAVATHWMPLPEPPIPFARRPTDGGFFNDRT